MSIVQEDLVSAAIKNSDGLDDFGGDDLWEPLRLLIKDINEVSGLSGNNFGLERTITALRKSLEIVLQYQHFLKIHPEIENIKIEKPLFIIGLPRTGSTMMHNLLSQDSQSRTFKFWELLNPIPQKNEKSGEIRIRMAEATLEKADQKRQLGHIHLIEVDRPEECNKLMSRSLRSWIFPWRYNCPNYIRWLENCDMAYTYRHYRRLLQLLIWQSKTEGQRLVLKDPIYHLISLDWLFREFPDANIIHIHRDISQTLSSSSSLMMGARRNFGTKPDALEIGNYIRWWSELSLRRGLEARSNFNKNQILDLSYGMILKDPIQAIKKIYDFFGYAIQPDFISNAEAWMTTHRQHKDGVHSYSPEQFAFDKKQLDQQFSFYSDFLRTLD
jgi:hypothetical protein